MIKEKQIFNAKVRAEVIEWVNINSTSVRGGGCEYLEEELNTHIQDMFGIDSLELSKIQTYSRQCTHEWSRGACSRCPS